MGNSLAATLMLAVMFAAGCSEQVAPSGQSGTAKKPRAEIQKPRTVVVNEGMSREEEEELSDRIAALEEEASDESTSQPAQEPSDVAPAQETEEAARAAAQDYYAAAAGGSYSYTYENLSAVSRGQVTEDEWITDNTALGSDAGAYSIDSVEAVDESTAEVWLTITSADGSSSERFTRFVLENGVWKHELTPEEYELFAGATVESAPASASASASSSAGSDTNAGTKRVEVVISSSKPADISISDDSLDWFVNEEITGTKTYERDIRENSGLSVSATTQAYRAQTSIEVYEDGVLVTQDTDPNGFALVNY